MTLIDIGANSLQGFEQLRNELWITDDWTIVLVEPNPECVERITDGTKDFSKVTFIKKAISTTKGKAVLYTRNDMQNDVAATIISKDVLLASIRKHNQEPKGVVEYEVETITLDELLNMATEKAVVKMDIEGSEFEILEQATDETLQKIDTLYCEFHPMSESDKIRKENIILKLSRLNVKVQEWS